MNIGICGIGGRMGNSILRIATEHGHKLHAAFDAEGSPFINTNAKELVNSPLADCVITSINFDALQGVDGVIDFSGPAATMKLVKILLELKKPLVIGTTGFSVSDVAEIKSC